MILLHAPGLSDLMHILGLPQLQCHRRNWKVSVRTLGSTFESLEHIHFVHG